MEILTLPMREGILYLPCPSGIGIEILTLSVRVSIGMFSAHIKEYGNTYSPHKGWYSILTLSVRDEYGNTYPVSKGESCFQNILKSMVILPSTQGEEFLYLTRKCQLEGGV